MTPATGARTTRFCRTQLPLPIASANMCCLPKFWRRRLSAVRLRAVRSLTENRPAITCAPDAAASTATCPNVRDDGQRPSSRDGMAGVLVLIWGNDEAEYFLLRSRKRLPRRANQLVVDAARSADLRARNPPLRPRRVHGVGAASVSHSRIVRCATRRR